MKKIIILSLLLCSLVVSLARAEAVEFYGFKLLPDITTAGGCLVVDLTSGGYGGNWGLAPDKTLIDFMGRLELRYQYEVFQTYNADSIALFYDLSPHIKALAISNALFNFKTGVWAGKRLDNGTYIAGVGVDVLKFNLVP